jgi:4-amino-4-deoxy-L-arabinose transferase-like glycosyltransferase
MARSIRNDPVSTESSLENPARTLPELPFRAVWLLVFVAYVVFQARYWWIPAYHDGIPHWDIARAMHQAPWYPFVNASDSGHPPLVSWLLGLLWWLPFPRLMAFHLLAWAAVATLVSSTFEIGRRHFGTGVGVGAALLTGLHPVVVAQALQLNLDLFAAAFTLVALVGATRRSPTMTTIGCVGATFSKLNGIFALLPISLWLLNEWARQPKRTSNSFARAQSPVLLTILLFAAYHGAKRGLTGHWFVTPDAVEANLTFVSSAGEYLGRFDHAWRQVFSFNNPNRFVAYALALSLAVLVLRGNRAHASTSTRAVVALLIALIVTQLALWSVRRYPSLVRYFIVLYPAFFLLTCAALATALGRFARAGLPAVLAPILLAFIAGWNPAYRRSLPPRLARSLSMPPTSVGTNHENSLDLIDQLDTFRQAVARLNLLVRTEAPDARTAVAWPYDHYLADPEHQITAHPLALSPWASVSGTQAEFALLTSSGDSTRSPSRAVIPSGYQVESAFSRGRAWTVLLRRERGRAVRPGPRRRAPEP